MVVFERKTGRILTGNNAPSAANLDKWLQEHPGFEVVRSTKKISIGKVRTFVSNISYVLHKSKKYLISFINKMLTLKRVMDLSAFEVMCLLTRTNLVKHC